MALGSTLLVCWADSLNHLHVLMSENPGSPNLLEPSGPI
jgi:hypothetical protein